MTVSFNGYDEKCLTFLGEASEGEVVKLSSDGGVQSCADSDAFAGVCKSCRDGCCCVQLGGYALVSFSGDAPSPGYAKLSADANGGVKTDENGREYLVLEADASGGRLGIIL